MSDSVAEYYAKYGNTSASETTGTTGSGSKSVNDLYNIYNPATYKPVEPTNNEIQNKTNYLADLDTKPTKESVLKDEKDSKNGKDKSNPFDTGHAALVKKQNDSRSEESKERQEKRKERREDNKKALEEYIKNQGTEEEVNRILGIAEHSGDPEDVAKNIWAESGVNNAEDYRKYGEKNNKIALAGEELMASAIKGTGQAINAVHAANVVSDATLNESLAKKSDAELQEYYSLLGYSQEDIPALIQKAKSYTDTSYADGTLQLDKVTHIGEGWEQDIQNRYGDMIKNDKVAATTYEFAQIIGNQLPSIALNAIPIVGQTLSTAYFWGSAMGSSIDEALESGATAGDAVMYGFMSGALETATEKMFDGMGLMFGGGNFDNITESVIARTVGTENKLLTNSMRHLFAYSGEGVEEIVSDLVNPFLQTIYNNKSGAESWAAAFDQNEDGKAQFNEVMGDLWESFYKGALSAVILQGVGNVAQKRIQSRYNTQNADLIQSRINSEIKLLESQGIEITDRIRYEIEQRNRYRTNDELKNDVLNSGLVDEALNTFRETRTGKNLVNLWKSIDTSFNQEINGLKLDPFSKINLELDKYSRQELAKRFGIKEAELQTFMERVGELDAVNLLSFVNSTNGEIRNLNQLESTLNLMAAYRDFMKTYEGMQAQDFSSKACEIVYNADLLAEYESKNGVIPGKSKTEKAKALAGILYNEFLPKYREAVAKKADFDKQFSDLNQNIYAENDAADKAKKLSQIEEDTKAKQKALEDSLKTFTTARNPIGYATEAKNIINNKKRLAEFLEWFKDDLPDGLKGDKAQKQRIIANLLQQEVEEKDKLRKQFESEQTKSKVKSKKEKSGKEEQKSQSIVNSDLEETEENKTKQINRLTDVLRQSIESNPDNYISYVRELLKDPVANIDEILASDVLKKAYTKLTGYKLTNNDTINKQRILASEVFKLLASKSPSAVNQILNNPVYRDIFEGISKSKLTGSKNNQRNQILDFAKKSNITSKNILSQQYLLERMVSQEEKNQPKIESKPVAKEEKSNLLLIEQFRNKNKKHLANIQNATDNFLVKLLNDAVSATDKESAKSIRDEISRREAEEIKRIREKAKAEKEAKKKNKAPVETNTNEKENPLVDIVVKKGLGKTTPAYLSSVKNLSTLENKLSIAKEIGDEKAIARIQAEIDKRTNRDAISDIESDIEAEVDSKIKSEEELALENNNTGIISEESSNNTKVEENSVLEDVDRIPPLKSNISSEKSKKIRSDILSQEEYDELKKLRESYISEERREDEFPREALLREEYLNALEASNLTEEDAKKIYYIAMRLVNYSREADIEEERDMLDTLVYNEIGKSNTLTPAELKDVINYLAYEEDSAERAIGYYENGMELNEEEEDFEPTAEEYFYMDAVASVGEEKYNEFERLFEEEQNEQEKQNERKKQESSGRRTDSTVFFEELPLSTVSSEIVGGEAREGTARGREKISFYPHVSYRNGVERRNVLLTETNNNTFVNIVCGYKTRTDELDFSEDSKIFKVFVENQITHAYYSVDYDITGKGILDNNKLPKWEKQQREQLKRLGIKEVYYYDGIAESETSDLIAGSCIVTSNGDCVLLLPSSTKNTLKSFSEDEFAAAGRVFIVPLHEFSHSRGAKYKERYGNKSFYKALNAVTHELYKDFYIDAFNIVSEIYKLPVRTDGNKYYFTGAKNKYSEDELHRCVAAAQDEMLSQILSGENCYGTVKSEHLSSIWADFESQNPYTYLYLKMSAELFGDNVADYIKFFKENNSGFFIDRVNEENILKLIEHRKNGNVKPSIDNSSISMDMYNIIPSRTSATPQLFTDEYGYFGDQVYDAATQLATTKTSFQKDSKGNIHTVYDTLPVVRKFINGEISLGELASKYLAGWESSTTYGEWYDPSLRPIMQKVYDNWESIKNNPNDEQSKRIYQLSAKRAVAGLASSIKRTTEANRVKYEVGTQLKDVNKVARTDVGKLAQNAAQFFVREQISDRNVFMMIDGFKDKGGIGYKMKDSAEKCLFKTNETIKNSDVFFLKTRMMNGYDDFIREKDGKIAVKYGRSGTIKLSQQQAVSLIKLLKSLSAQDVYYNGENNELVWTKRANTIEGFAIKGKGDNFEFIKLNDILPNYYSKYHKNINSDEGKINVILNLQHYLEGEINNVAKSYMEACDNAYEYLGTEAAKTTEKIHGYRPSISKKGEYIQVWYRSPEDTGRVKTDLDLGIATNGNMEERVKETGGYVIVSQIGNVMENYINQMSNYVGYANFADMMTRVNRTTNTSTGLSYQLQNSFGRQYGTWFNEYVKDINDFRDEDDSGSKILRAGRIAIQSGALFGSLSVPMKQISSYWSASGVVSPEALWKCYRWKFVKEKGYGANNAMLYTRQSKADPSIYEVLSDKSFVGKLKNNSNFLRKIGEVIIVEDYRTVDNIYTACIYDIAKQNPGLDKNSDEFQQKVDDLFNRAVIETQPIYNKNARPEYARTNNEFIKGLAMFRTQQTQNFNRLITAFGELSAAKNEFGVDSAEFKAKRKQARQTIQGQATASISLAILSTAADILLHSLSKYRDDDEEENNVPVLNISSDKLLQYLIIDSSEALAGTAWFGDQIASFLIDQITGGDTKEFYGINLGPVTSVVRSYEILENAIKYKTPASINTAVANISQTFGIPYRNAYKLINSIVMYVSDITGGNKEKYDDLIKFVSKKTGTTYEKDRKANRLINAELNGNTNRAVRLANKIAGSGTQEQRENRLADAVLKTVKNQYINNDDMSSNEAKNLLLKYTGLYGEEIQDKLDEWDYSWATRSQENPNGLLYSEMEKDYIAGKISKSDVIKYRQLYGGEMPDEVQKTVNKWQMEIDTGVKYSDMKDAIKAGDITVNQAITYRQKYGGETDKEANASVAEYLYNKNTGRDWDRLDEEYYRNEISDSQLLDYLTKYKYFGDANSAKTRLKVYQWNKKYPEYELSFSENSEKHIAKYETYAESVGISVAYYENFIDEVAGIKGDKDNNNETISGTKTQNVHNYIAGLNLSNSQKQSLWEYCIKTLNVSEKTKWYFVK